jgi:hypothetical protein
MNYCLMSSAVSSSKTASVSTKPPPNSADTIHNY